jgi:uncharacterized protein YydD (DUF2326 family)
MFIKSLSILQEDGYVIRDIHFHNGLNLIVDETPIVGGKETGNNVGKTTVIKLVDFCFGADPKSIFTDTENKTNEYKAVKDFLINNKVIISLILKDDLKNQDSREVLIERNFLARPNRILRINGQKKTDIEFEEFLTNLLFPGHFGKKPTFRQIIAHNIRYRDISVNNTLKNLDSFTRLDEYETLYLFLFGCSFEQGELKQKLRTQIDLEEKFNKRLESEQTKSAYETALALLQSEIEVLEQRKASLNINPNFESNLDNLNELKYKINLVTSEISRLELRKNLIIESQEEIQSGASNIDIKQLEQIYRQATSLVTDIQRTFEELYIFHNRMVESKIRFIVQDLPRLDKEISDQRDSLNRLLAEESKLSSQITQSDSYEMLERLIAELNIKYQTKGSYEKIISQIKTTEVKLYELNKKLAEIDDELFSDEFSFQIQEQINKFNKFFSAVSNELYGEKYAIKFDPRIIKGRRIYEFTAFNTNFSSGKKQGEISCFDIAYTLFADEESIPCMHFLLNDKKELMHDNQLIKITNLVNTKNIQFVASILSDKLPEELNKDDFIVLKLSQTNKLFKIENE